LIESEGKSIELDLHKEPSIGTTLYFSKNRGLIGYGSQTFFIDLKNQQKFLEETQNDEEILSRNVKQNENKASLRLESITEWLEENKSRFKKRKKVPESEENEKKDEKITRKTIRKRKKNINSLLNRLKT